MVNWPRLIHEGYHGAKELVIMGWLYFRLVSKFYLENYFFMPSSNSLFHLEVEYWQVASMSLDEFVDGCLRFADVFCQGQAGDAVNPTWVDLPASLVLQWTWVRSRKGYSGRDSGGGWRPTRWISVIYDGDHQQHVETTTAPWSRSRRLIMGCTYCESQSSLWG